MNRERLILFTRFPLAGRAKTRLIPRLGADGAAQLQREMTEHVLTRAFPLVKRRGVKLEVRFEDGSQTDMRRWLGRAFAFVPQELGDLGERMLRATNEAFGMGMDAVVVIGADCPELDAALIERAFDALRSHPVVFGPAKDGGYYLTGLRQPRPALFQGIAWSTANVLADSIARAHQMGIEPYLLPELSDVDEPADLPAWEKARQTSRTVSVVIPTLNEAEHLPLTLKQVAAGEPTEIIVADGGSHDDTLRIAESHGATLVSSPPNRAHQMNAGAAAARSDTLLFLHADTLLPANYCDAVHTALRSPDIVGGAFRFQIGDSFPGRWLVESTTNLRSRLWRMPDGDQALFVRRWAFDELGSFPELPIMEDYTFVSRLRRHTLLKAAAVTSGRRWQRLGYANVEFRKGRIQDLGLDLEVLDAELKKHPIANANTFLRALELAADLRVRHPLIETESVDAVVSNCVLNLVEAQNKQQLFQEIFHVLRKGGRAVISDIVSDEDVPDAMQQDPTLWSDCISGALREDLFLKAFEDAGFYGICLLKREQQPWQTVQGIEFRSVTVEAFKGKQGECWELNQAVIYRGPFREVLDDDGHRLRRGERVAVCDKTFNLYRRAPFADHFEFVEPRVPIKPKEATPFACGPTRPRHAGETKGTEHKVTTTPSRCCDGGGNC